MQGVDKSIFWVYDALVKAKASLSIKLLDAFAFLFFWRTRRLSFMLPSCVLLLFPPGSPHFEKERLLWVQFPIILAVWYLMTG